MFQQSGSPSHLRRIQSHQRSRASHLSRDKSRFGSGKSHLNSTLGTKAVTLSHETVIESDLRTKKSHERGDIGVFPRQIHLFLRVNSLFGAALFPDSSTKFPCYLSAKFGYRSRQNSQKCWTFWRVVARNLPRKSAQKSSVTGKMGKTGNFRERPIRFRLRGAPFSVRPRLFGLWRCLSASADFRG